MVHFERSPFDAELRASPRWVLALMLAAAVLLGLVAGLRTDPPPWLMAAVMLLVLTAAAGLDLYAARPLVSAWLAVLGLVLVIFLAAAWSGYGALLTLLAVTTVLTATLVSLPAALVLSAAQSVGLLTLTVMPTPGILTADIVIALIAIWSAFAAMLTSYRPIRHLAAWSWQYYRDAQTWLEQAQADRAQLESSLADLVHSHRQRSLAHEREAALRRAAEEARQDKARFAARVSHEFRTPLNVIIGMISLIVEKSYLYDEVIPPLLMEHLQAVYRNCRHLANLVDDVLDLSQADAGRVRLHRERVSVADLVASAVSVIRPLIERKGLSLDVNVPPGMPALTCDRIRIRQVLLNLLSNAVRFTDRGGIMIQAAPDDGDLLLRVTDTGKGMSPEDAAQVFEPFVQGGNDPGGARGGSGLGLSISKQFVELHDGQIWLESTVEMGTTFYVRLPLDEMPPPLGGPGRWNKEEWQWVEGQGRAALPKEHYRPRLLLWDETGGLVDAAAGAEAVEIVEVGDAAAFVELARETVHAIIVNAYPPARLEPLLATARCTLPDTPVLAATFLPLSAYAERAGVLAFVTKPLTLPALAEAVDRLPTPPRRALVVDDDPDAREVMRLMLAALAADMAVTEATDGATALALLTADPPDLLLLDIVMPGMSGWEVLDAKQGDSALCGVPTIIVSAQDVIEAPPVSERLLLTTGMGFTGGQVVDCALAVGKALLHGGRDNHDPAS